MSDGKTPIYKNIVFHGYIAHESGSLTDPGGDLVRAFGRPYPMVTLTYDNGERLQRVTLAVHKLMCWTFHGPPPFDGAMVRHINDHKLDWHAENLAWGSAKDNSEDRKKNRAAKYGNIQFAEPARCEGPNAPIENECLHSTRDGLGKREVPSIVGTFGFRRATFFVFGKYATCMTVYDKLDGTVMRARTSRADSALNVDRKTWVWLQNIIDDQSDDMSKQVIRNLHFEVTAHRDEIMDLGDWLASLICARVWRAELDPQPCAWTAPGPLSSSGYTWTTAAAASRDRFEAHQESVREAMIRRRSEK